MKKNIKSIICAIWLGCLLFLPGLALAQGTPPTTSSATGLMQRLQNVAGEGGYQTDPNIASTPKIVGTVIGAFLGFLGLVFLVLMIIAGYNWMAADGNEEEVKKSKNIIKQAIIGMVVALAAYSIWNFVFQRFILLSN
ncbi:MAG: hypothetical protein NTY31_03360 [Candidatus Falkowbacteria bacterium]|nr:hypothetical protein [Candidatus Falkowbacteria bacterium]